MNLHSLHILLTYRCNYECDHCFVWGSPRQSGVFTWEQLETVFDQALTAGCIDEFYFEGGESFVYYPVLVKAVARAHQLGFATGVVTNGYWATSEADALMWLRELVEAGLQKLEISCDSFHGETAVPAHEHIGIQVARRLKLDASLLTLRSSATVDDIRYRGRAAIAMTPGRRGWPWPSFDTCPYESLSNPGRVHVDPFGNVHLCQGLVMGNLWQQPLSQILEVYDSDNHPVVRDLIAGGPAQIVRSHQLEIDNHYVDACHLCYSARTILRDRYPQVLAPDQMYGVVGDD